MLHLKHKVLLCEPKSEFEKLEGGKALATDHHEQKNGSQLDRWITVKNVSLLEKGQELEKWVTLKNVSQLQNELTHRKICYI